MYGGMFETISNTTSLWVVIIAYRTVSKNQTATDLPFHKTSLDKISEVPVVTITPTFSPTDCMVYKSSGNMTKNNKIQSLKTIADVETKLGSGYAGLQIQVGFFPYAGYKYEQRNGKSLYRQGEKKHAF